MFSSYDFEPTFWLFPNLYNSVLLIIFLSQNINRLWFKHFAFDRNLLLSLLQLLFLFSFIISDSVLDRNAFLQHLIAYPAIWNFLVLAALTEICIDSISYLRNFFYRHHLSVCVVGCRFRCFSLSSQYTESYDFPYICRYYLLKNAVILQQRNNRKKLHSVYE